MHRVDEYFKKLKSKGFKLTPQRVRILKAIGLAEGHLDVWEIYQSVNREYPPIGLATVYRTLDLLKKLGVVNGLGFGEGHQHYEISPEHHHHLVCLKCGSIEEFDEQVVAKLEAVDKLEKELSGKLGFKIIDHQLEFYGYCSKCRKIQTDPKDFKEQGGL